MNKYLIFSLLCCSLGLAKSPVPLWPTTSQAFWEEKPYTAYIQPTAAGKPESGLYGCVRSQGHKFHEGIDIRAEQRTRKNEPKDKIILILPGRVAYVNDTPGDSAYGRYIVVDHATSPRVYSLYAHLSEVDPSIRQGVTVDAGTVLGVMGRSANHSIPKYRAHLHFEVGLRLTDRFQAWYDQTVSGKPRFSSKNKHGVWNGMNLIGADPLSLYEQVLAGTYSGVQAWLQSEGTAFTIEVVSAQVPDFIRRYPELLASPIPPKGLRGWKIEFTRYGIPKRWHPLEVTEGIRAGMISLLAYDPEVLGAGPCPGMVQIKEGQYILGKRLRRTLSLLFI